MAVSITKFHFYPKVPIAIALVETLTIKFQMHLSETEIVMPKQIPGPATMTVAIVAHMIETSILVSHCTAF